MLMMLACAGALGGKRQQLMLLMLAEAGALGGKSSS